MTEKSYLVFVYGTLMTGMGNHNKLVGEGGDATFVDRGSTITKMKMYAAGVPFVDPDERSCIIHGEVWEVDYASLARMDALEGHPDWYFRLSIEIQLQKDGRIVLGEIYVNRKFKEFGMDEQAVVVESGDFRDADTLSKQQTLRKHQHERRHQKNELSVCSGSSASQVSTQRSFTFSDLIDPEQYTVEKLPCQFDAPFKTTPHQCSWFAIGVVAHAAAFRRAWEHRDIVAFRQRWSNLLRDATRLRRQTDPDHSEIQTLCSPTVLEHFHVTLGESVRHVIIHPEIEDPFEASLLTAFKNAAEVKQTKLSFPKGTWEGLLAKLHAASQTNPMCMVAHRRGKAFAALSVMSGLKRHDEPAQAMFLILDSHIRKVGVMTAENLVSYVQEHPVEDAGYGLVMWSTSVTVVESSLLGKPKSRLGNEVEE